MEGKEITHESYGKISICRYSGNKQEFFGSDIFQDGGIEISISTAYLNRHLNTDWIHSKDELIKIKLSANQYVDAITSGMNTDGVPCTIKRFNGKSIEQIPHVIDKQELYLTEMNDTQQEYKSKIDDLIAKLDGNIGKKKAAEIKQGLEVLKSHISSNVKYVQRCFKEDMEKSVTEAKQSVSNYIDNKVNTLGIKALKDQLSIAIEKE
jgi:hypothetical protein